MSVINKMLRDLDQRHNASAAAPAAFPATSALRKGTASIASGGGSGRHVHPGLWLGLGALALATVSTGGWLWWYRAASLHRMEPVVAPVAVASSPASAPATPVAAESEPATAMALRMESSLSTRQALDALLRTPAPAAVPTPALAHTLPTPTPTTATATAAVAAPAPGATPAPAGTAHPKAHAPAVAVQAAAGETTPPAVQRRQPAGDEAIVQAQNLWNAGSRDAAIDLMQEALAVAERGAQPSTTSGAANPVLVSLARETARMQLAEARFGAVWELLTRLEPLLGNQADLWAIRANAAQRLGRHQDSVHAYMMALESRPDEQRWLLGTAVSLAALGQITSAAAMVDKARASGPVSKDILAYLRQTGVPLREQ